MTNHNISLITFLQDHNMKKRKKFIQKLKDNKYRLISI